MNYLQFMKIGALALFSINTYAQSPVKLSNNQFQFVEGPVWDGSNIIYFSDIPANKVVSYNINTKTFSDVIVNANRPNGLMFTKDYDLLVCEGSAGRITRRTVNGQLLETIADTFNGVRLNDPNDLCIDKKGGIYFTDPNFVFTHQPENRLYYRDASGNISSQDAFARGKPNGVIISPDGKYLYLDNSESTVVYRYNIDAATGNLSNRIQYGTLAGANDSGADGMAVDTDGKLYVTSRSTVQVFDGSRLTAVRTINFPEKATNCTFGGVNKDILFVTAGQNLYEVTGLGVIGVQHPFDLSENTTEPDVIDPVVPVDTDPDIDPQNEDTYIVQAEDFEETGGTFGGFETYSTNGVTAINFNQTGDWAEYELDIVSDGVYEVSYAIATPVNGAAIELQVGNQSIKDNVPNNGGWDAFTELKTSETIELKKGVQSIRILGAGTNSGNWEWNMDFFRINKIGEIPNEAVTPVRPVNPVRPVANIEINVEAELFTQTDGRFDGVQTYTLNGVTATNFNQTGDFVDYTVTIPDTGNYYITYHISTPVDNTAVEFLVDGISQLKSNVPNNRSWDNFRAFTTSESINLTRGEHTIRLVGAGTNPGKWEWNLDRFVISNTQAGSKVLSSANVSDTIYITPNPVRDSFNIAGLLPNTTYTFKINDFIGKTLVEGKVNSIENSIIGLEILSVGIYFLQIKDVDGQVSKTIKVNKK